MTSSTKRVSLPSYDAVIPADVRYDKSLPPMARLLYGEIRALCNQEGYCWASNDYFASLYEKHAKTISAWVCMLANSGYIVVEIDQEAGNERKIYIADSKVKSPIQHHRSKKKADDLSAKSRRPYPQKDGDPIRKKTEHNSKSIIVRVEKVHTLPAVAGERVSVGFIEVDEAVVTYYEKAQKEQPLQDYFIQELKVSVTDFLSHLQSFHRKNLATSKVHQSWSDYSGHLIDSYRVQKRGLKKAVPKTTTRIKSSEGYISASGKL